MSTRSSTAYQDPMAVHTSGSMEGHLVDVTTAEHRDGLSSSSDGQQDLVNANGQTGSLDAGGPIHTTNTNGQYQGSTDLGPINAAGLNQGLTYLGPDEGRHGVDVTAVVITQSRIPLSLIDDDQIPDSQTQHPITDNKGVIETDNDVDHGDLAGFVNPPPH